MTFDTAKPFVLLDDARPGGVARLYRAPRNILRADTVDAVPGVLHAIDVAVDAGHRVAGFLSYEAGLPADRADPPALPLAWFGVFDTFEQVAGDALCQWLPDPAGAWAGAPRSGVSRADHRAAFDRVRDWIEAGDIYQANLTFRAQVPVAGSPLALYAALRPHAAAGHGGVVWTGSDWLLSFSPESFFTIEDDRIGARPMKGTAPRGTTPADDARAAAALADDPKQRAENLMIVDLMRNDLSQVSVAGSVAVPERFVVETYPSVHQMVSQVTATLLPGTRATTALAALFPCGSITGAPKLRAIEVIAAVEAGPRGIYTGAIGRIDGDGDAAFNVAIRTLHLRDGADHATIGLGSGIVADSDADAEWDECLAKGRFVARAGRPFDLIETMAFDPHIGICLLDRHLDRMRESAQRFGFAFDHHAIRNELQAATFRLRAPSRVRLLLSRSGAVAITVSALPSAPADPVDVALVPLPVEQQDWRLRHKTTDRAFYNAARLEAGTFEVVFVDEDGMVGEGSFTSVFVEREDGRLATPPQAQGLLPGVLRAELLDTGQAYEAPLQPSDLAQGFYVGNAVRGLIRARPVAGPGYRG